MLDATPTKRTKQPQSRLFPRSAYFGPLGPAISDTEERLKVYENNAPISESEGDTAKARNERQYAKSIRRLLVLGAKKAKEMAS